MNIEIVEFYPEKGNSKKFRRFIGTLHIYIVDSDIDLRGIDVFKYKEKFTFFLPHKRSLDPETGILIKYPVFAYSNQNKNKELIEAIISKGSEYIIDQMKDLKTKQCVLVV